MTEDERQSGFWHTIPGILTGITTIITALTGLVVAIQQTGLFNGVDQEQTQAEIEVDKKPKQLSGNYYVRGKNPNGTQYLGTAVIQQENDRYDIVWTIGNGQKFYGSGALVNNILKIQWEQGIVTYIMREDGTLEGSWAKGQGTETLIPYSNN